MSSVDPAQSTPHPPREAFSVSAAAQLEHAVSVFTNENTEV